MNLLIVFPGLVVGFLLTLGSYAFFINLLVFFVSSSKATKYKAALKRKLEVNFKEGNDLKMLSVLP